MPFREIKQPTGFIRIKTDGKITISLSLIPKFFKEKTHVKIFYDEKNKLIGFQPSNIGYKIQNHNRHATVTCHSISRIIQGEFYPTWSKKFGMLVFSIEGKVAN